MKWPKITKDTPMEELKRIHQAIWDYAIEHGEKPETPYRSNCIACEWGDMHENHCLSCPIIWPGNRGCNSCLEEGGLYRQFYQDCSILDKAELAKQIRDLPWKFEQEGS